RRVPNPPPHLGGDASGGGSGGDVALLVQRNYADRAELMSIRRFDGEHQLGAGLSRRSRRRSQGTWRNRLAFFLQFFYQALPAALRKEKTGINHFQTMLRCKLIRAVADEHDMRRFLHDSASERDRMARACDPRNRTSLQIRPVHNG